MKAAIVFEDTPGRQGEVDIGLYSDAEAEGEKSLAWAMASGVYEALADEDEGHE